MYKIVYMIMLYREILCGRLKDAVNNNVNGEKISNLKQKKRARRFVKLERRNGLVSLQFFNCARARSAEPSQEQSRTS